MWWLDEAENVWFFISTLMRPHSRMSTMDVFCLEAVYTFYFQKYQHCQYFQWVIKSLLNKTRDSISSICICNPSIIIHFISRGQIFDTKPETWPTIKINNVLHIMYRNTGIYYWSSKCKIYSAINFDVKPKISRQTA